MEERNGGGVHTSGAGGDDHIALGDHTHLSGGLDTVRFNDGLQFEGSHIREDQTDLTLGLLDQGIQLGHRLGSELLIELTVIHILLVGQFLGSHGNGSLDDGVLADY